MKNTAKSITAISSFDYYCYCYFRKNLLSQVLVIALINLRHEGLLNALGYNEIAEQLFYP